MAKNKIKGGKKINKAINELQKIAKQKSGLLVGLPKDASPYPDGTSVIMVGIVHEFGSSDGKIPERSFLRSSLDENRETFLKFWKDGAAKSILTLNKNSKDVLPLLGQMMQAAVQQKIVTLRSPALKLQTIINKKSSNPLIDTGHMRQSIRWEFKK